MYSIVVLSVHSPLKKLIIIIIIDFRGVQRQPRQRKMRHRNPQGRGTKIRKLGGDTVYFFVFRENKCNNNSISAGAPPQMPLGELTALPQIP